MVRNGPSFDEKGLERRCYLIFHAVTEFPSQLLEKYEEPQVLSGPLSEGATPSWAISFKGEGRWNRESPCQSPKDVSHPSSLQESSRPTETKYERHKRSVVGVSVKVGVVLSTVL
jgi:hypothetical protein